MLIANKKQKISTENASVAQQQSSELTLADLPREIVKLIIEFTIKNDLDVILALSLTCTLMRDLAEELAQKFSTEYWGALGTKLSQQMQPHTSAGIYLRLSQHEAKRLTLCTYFLTSNQPIPTGTFAEQPKVSVSYHGLFAARNAMIALLPTAKTVLQLRARQIDLATMTITSNHFIPDLFELYLTSAVNARAYETLTAICQTIKDSFSAQINIACILDCIYYHTIENYTGLEFMQLTNLLPIDINKRIATPVYGISSASYMLKQPLLHIAVGRGNLNLVKYLVDNGAKLNQLSSDGESVVNTLKHNLEHALKEIQTNSSPQVLYKKLHQDLLAVQDYLETAIVQANERDQQAVPSLS